MGKLRRGELRRVWWRGSWRLFRLWCSTGKFCKRNRLPESDFTGIHSRAVWAATAHVPLGPCALVLAAGAQEEGEQEAVEEEGAAAVEGAAAAVSFIIVKSLAGTVTLKVINLGGGGGS